MDETSQLFKCPHCGRRTDPGRFCQRCGKPLAGAPDDAGGRTCGESVKSQPDVLRLGSASPSTLTPSDGGMGIDFAGGRTCGEPVPPQPDVLRLGSASPSSVAPSSHPQVSAPSIPRVSLPPIPNPQPPIPNPQYPTPSWQPHPRAPLLAEYNFARAFVAGQIYPFQFQLRLLRPDVERVAICFRGHLNGISLPSDQEVTVELSCDYEAPWDVTFAPPGGSVGEASIQLYLGCQMKGGQEWQWLQASVQHRIYPAQTSAREAAHSIAINISQNIAVNGHANDVTARDTVEELERLARQTDPDRKACELVDQMASMRLFKTLRLLPSRPPIPHPFIADYPPPVMPPEARVNALTLRCGDGCLHLLGTPTVRFGRHREDNDLVARVFELDGRLNEDASMLISKIHGRIEHQGCRCIVADMNSSFGVALDGRLLPANEVGKLNTSGRHQLTLAASDRVRGRGMTWDLEPWHCGHERNQECPHAGGCSLSAPASLHIRRRDGLRESYLLVWRCAPLDEILPEMTGARIFRLDGGFQLRRPGRAPQWLAPGVDIAAPGGGIAVKAFGQLGLDKSHHVKGKS